MFIPFFKKIMKMITHVYNVDIYFNIGILLKTYLEKNIDDIVTIVFSGAFIN